MQKVSEVTLSVYATSKKYDIPKRTISWHLKKQQNGGLKKTGLEKVLTGFEEEQLVKWLGVSSDLGDPNTKDDLVRAALDEWELRKFSDSLQFKNEIQQNIG